MMNLQQVETYINFAGRDEDKGGHLLRRREVEDESTVFLSPLLSLSPHVLRWDGSSFVTWDFELGTSPSCRRSRPPPSLSWAGPWGASADPPLMEQEGGHCTGGWEEREGRRTTEEQTGAIKASDSSVVPLWTSGSCWGRRMGKLPAFITHAGHSLSVSSCTFFFFFWLT